MRKGVVLVTICRRPTNETECYAVHEEAIGTTSMYTTYIPRASQSADKILARLTEILLNHLSPRVASLLRVWGTGANSDPQLIGRWSELLLLLFRIFNLQFNDIGSRVND